MIIVKFFLCLLLNTDNLHRLYKIQRQLNKEARQLTFVICVTQHIVTCDNQLSN